MTTDKLPIYPDGTLIIHCAEANEESVSLGFVRIGADVVDTALVPHYLVCLEETYSRCWGLECIGDFDLAFGLLIGCLCGDAFALPLRG
jgi:hypothetical protein